MQKTKQVVKRLTQKELEIVELLRTVDQNEFNAEVSSMKSILLKTEYLSSLIFKISDYSFSLYDFVDCLITADEYEKIKEAIRQRKSIYIYGRNVSWKNFILTSILREVIHQEDIKLAYLPNNQVVDGIEQILDINKNKSIEVNTDPYMLVKQLMLTDSYIIKSNIKFGHDVQLMLHSMNCNVPCLVTGDQELTQWIEELSISNSDYDYESNIVMIKPSIL